MSGWTKELQAGARAMRSVVNKYSVVRDIIRCFDVYDHSDAKVVFSATTTEECYDWIDCQAFAAVLASLLPVSDGIVDMLEAQPHFDCTSFSDLFTAATRHIIGEQP